MNVFVVCYDLIKPHKDYSLLINALKALSTWCHPVDSTWIVPWNGTAASLRDHLKRFIDDNDKIVVLQVAPSWATSGVANDANDWFHRYVA